MAKKEIVNNAAATIRVDESVVEAFDGAIDIVTDSMDSVVESVERIVTVTRNNPFVLAAAVVVGAAIGGFVAYKVSAKRTADRYEDILVEEIAAAKEFHKRLAKQEEFSSPEEAVNALVPEEVVEAVGHYQGRGQMKVPYNQMHKPEEPVVEIETMNVFINNSLKGKDMRHDWDYEVQVAERDANPELPYVISMDEFNADEQGYDHDTLTYYTEDDTLTDARDQMIDDSDGSVGDDNLTKFGFGSNDHNVVYVRNEKLGMDYEIVRSKGSYQNEVLGIDPQPVIRHSDRRSPQRRFRGTDE